MSAATLKTYVLVYAALIVLLAATVGIAYIDLGTPNVAIALAIATIKSLLVMIWFMHLKEAEHIDWVFASAGFFFLLVLLGLTFVDFASRP